MTRIARTRWLLILTFLTLVAASAWGLWRYGYTQALGQLARQGASDLAVASDRLTGQLQRYRELAVLMADHPQVRAVLDGGDPANLDALLLEVADKTAALDLLLVDASGVVLAAADSDAGADLGKTAYVRRAMQGALGTAHGFGVPFDARVYYHAAPVYDGPGAAIGAMVVAADLGALEADWRGSNPAVVFTDAQGRVFVTNRSELVFWKRPPDAAGLVPDDAPEPAFSSYRVGGHEVWQMGWGPYLPQNALHIVRPLPVIGFLGEALIDVAPARRLAVLQAAAFAALCLAFGALLYVATERRRTLSQANAQLEARVAERTAELAGTNAQLRREATEREEAQAALAQAQADLVQAGKLGALGHLSAGISHELNQPLMAISNYAENAGKFIAGGKSDRAADNLSRIADMARRMGRIIKNLRAFARQESEAHVRVNVVEVLRSAVELTGPHMREGDVTLSLRVPDHPVWVRGGDVRLSQVFVNLITNAVDAMSGRPQRLLSIAIEDGPAPRVTVQDTGPGIDMPDKVFDPFYTTKTQSDADGMGLGLSISYGIVQSFGGEIKGANTGSGAEFTVQLQPWQDAVEAA